MKNLEQRLFTKLKQKALVPILAASLAFAPTAYSMPVPSQAPKKNQPIYSGSGDFQYMSSDDVKVWLGLIGIIITAKIAKHYLQKQ